MINRLINRYGRAVKLCDTEKAPKECKALIQPLRYKNKMYLQGIHTPIGISHEGYYLYIGTSENDLTALSDEAYVETPDGSYKIDRAEKVWHGEKVVYIWAILRGPEVYDDEQSSKSGE